jgi:hypothetical protein
VTKLLLVTLPKLAPLFIRCGAFFSARSTILKHRVNHRLPNPMERSFGLIAELALRYRPSAIASENPTVAVSVERRDLSEDVAKGTTFIVAPHSIVLSAMYCLQL